MSSILYFVFKSVPCFIISFAGGFLIDLDHVLDYYLHTGVNLKVANFFKYYSSLRFEYLTVIFHSFELLFLLWLAIYAFGLGSFWVALAVGFSQHMILDLVGNSKFLKTHSLYFLTIRALKGFRFREFFRSASK